MFYDTRISIGMFFTLIGTILTAFGVATRDHADAYSKSLGIDANLWWGLVLLMFGIVALTLGRRGQIRLEKASAGQQEPGNKKSRSPAAH